MTSDRAEFTEEQLLFVMIHTSNKIQSYKMVSVGKNKILGSFYWSDVLKVASI